MFKTRRAAVAVACVAGATLGAIGTSTPAFAAGTGAATYNCSYTDPSTGYPVTNNDVYTVWKHNTYLFININLQFRWGSPPGGIYTVVNGVTVNNLVTYLPYEEVALKAINVPGTITGPPNPLIVQFVGPPAMTATCILQIPPSPIGWPI